MRFNEFRIRVPFEKLHEFVQGPDRIICAAHQMDVIGLHSGAEKALTVFMVASIIDHSPQPTLTRSAQMTSDA